MSLDDDLLARAALMRAADVGDKLMGRLVAHFGPVETLRLIRAYSSSPALSIAAPIPAEAASWSALGDGNLEGPALWDGKLHWPGQHDEDPGRISDPASVPLAGATPMSPAGGPVGAVGATLADFAFADQASAPQPDRAVQRAQEARLTRRLLAWQARLKAADPEVDLAAGERSGARLVVPGAPEWPTQLDQLGPSRPLGLWVNGAADLRYSCLRSVAIVGARAATPYGMHVATDFAATLAESGWTVVSGGALGIDGAAHRGALAADGPTIAVLACGVDIAYPSGHHDLFTAIRADGAIISECPPGVHPTRARFLIRNRLIAALSRGTLVVEAALRSGALNTATHAASLSRHVAAVPGPITSEMSSGCHRLLRERKAICVTTPAELVDLVGAIGDDLAPTLRGPAVPHDALSETTRRVLDAVPTRSGAGTATIAVEAGTDLSTTLSALGGLAAAGFIIRTEKGWRLKPHPTPQPSP